MRLPHRPVGVVALVVLLAGCATGEPAGRDARDRTLVLLSHSDCDAKIADALRKQGMKVAEVEAAAAAAGGPRREERALPRAGAGAPPPTETPVRRLAFDRPRRVARPAGQPRVTPPPVGLTGAPRPAAARIRSASARLAPPDRRDGPGTPRREPVRRRRGGRPPGRGSDRTCPRRGGTPPVRGRAGWPRPSCRRSRRRLRRGRRSRAPAGRSRRTRSGAGASPRDRGPGGFLPRTGRRERSWGCRPRSWPGRPRASPWAGGARDESRRA